MEDNTYITIHLHILLILHLLLHITLVTCILGVLVGFEINSPDVLKTHVQLLYKL